MPIDEQYCIGSVPLKVFLQDMKKGYNKKELKACIKRADFSEVPKATDDRAMHQSFACAARRLKISERMEFFACSDMADAQEEIQPDLGVRLLPVGHTSDQWKDPDGDYEAQAFDYYRDLLSIEIKTGDLFVECMCSCNNPHCPQAETPSQAALYADSQFARQHRRFLYQLMLIGRHAWLVYYDHAGLVVSQSFDYVDDKELLVTFLWLLARMSPEQQGFDQTVRPATDAEALIFTHKMREFCTTLAQDGYTLPQAHDIQSSRSPIYVAQVPQASRSKPTREVIFSDAFSSSGAAPGRGTRTFLAYDTTDKQVRMLRDSWAVVHPAVLPEMDVYHALRKADVPCLPDVVCGGSVSWRAKVQRTTVQDWLQRHARTRGVFSSGHRRIHEHVRILMEACLPIQCVGSSQDFVRVLRDILSAYDAAVSKAGIIHRNLGPGNVVVKLVDGKPKGVLIGWDHAGYVKSDMGPAGETDDSTLPYCSTAWKFASADLLSDERKEDRKHMPLDDMQSILWMLVYCGMHYFAHSPTTYATSPAQLFDEKQKSASPSPWASLFRKFDGYWGKMEAIRTDKKLSELRFSSGAFQTLIDDLALAWRYYYAFRMLRDLHEAEYQIALAKVESPKWLLQMLDDALSSGTAEGTWTQDRIAGWDHGATPVRVQHRQRENDVTSTATSGGDPDSGGVDRELARQPSGPPMDAHQSSAKRRHSDSDGDHDYKPPEEHKRARMDAGELPDDARPVIS